MKQNFLTVRSSISVTPLIALLLLANVLGCAQAYYSAMEQVGQHKRDILRSRIEGAREDQQEAQEQFKTTYERFAEAAGYRGGDLESIYNDLNTEYERSTDRAESVSDRIESIENVAEALFVEWKAETDLYTSPKLRDSSRASLNDTKKRYASLIGAMKRAESKMQPVLGAVRDQVLFLKHNLNARAIASLEGTLGEIESDVSQLIAEIDTSIREAESFLDSFDGA